MIASYFNIMEKRAASSSSSLPLQPLLLLNPLCHIYDEVRFSGTSTERNQTKPNHNEQRCINFSHASLRHDEKRAKRINIK